MCLEGDIENSTPAGKAGALNWYRDKQMGSD